MSAIGHASRIYLFTGANQSAQFFLRLSDPIWLPQGIDSRFGWNSPATKQLSPAIPIVFSKHVKFSHNFARELDIGKPARSNESSIADGWSIDVHFRLCVLWNLLTKICQSIAGVTTTSEQPSPNNCRGSGADCGERYLTLVNFRKHTYQLRFRRLLLPAVTTWQN